MATHIPKLKKKPREDIRQTLIIEADNESGLGEVYVGGFKAAINEEFLKENNIKHIINAAGKELGLKFGPKYMVSSV